MAFPAVRGAGFLVGGDAGADVLDLGGLVDLGDGFVELADEGAGVGGALGRVLLDGRRQLPRQVELTIRPKKGLLGKRHTLRSEHLLTRQLVESDRKRVAQTDQLMAMYSPVTFREYQRNMAE